MTYIKAWFGQIRSGTTELAAFGHLKIDVALLSRFRVVAIPGK